MFRRILVPLDGSRFAEAACPHALEIAERLDAALELATVANPDVPGEVQEPSPDIGDDSRDVARRHAGEYLAEVEERLRSGGYTGEVARSVIPPGNVAHALVRHLHDRDCDLTVLTTHGRGPVKRAWLGSSADAFIRRSPVPALLIRPSAKGSGNGSKARGPLSSRAEPIRRVLFPLDGSGEAERMLETAAPLIADESGEACVLLRVVPPFIPGGSPYMPHVVREVESQAMVKKAAWDYLDGLKERAPCGEVEESVVTDGQAAMAILRVAEDEDVDLVAMSTAGRGGVARLFLGSVADKVVRGAEVPVLVHREPSED